MVDHLVISGASGGLGKAIAKSYQGKLPISGIYHKNPPNDLAGIELYKFDFGSKNDFNNIRIEKNARITFIHAAVVSIDSLFVNTDLEELEKSLKINLLSAVEISKMLMPKMMRANYGRFIYLSSIIVDKPRIGTAAYSISKKGIDILSKTIALEYATFGITSNVIKLGYFETGLGSKLSINQQKEILNRIPKKRFGSVTDILTAINFIQNCQYMTGSEIILDGGYNVS